MGLYPDPPPKKSREPRWLLSRQELGSNRRNTILHQRGALMMAQGILGFQYEVEQRSSGLTVFGGLLLYLELAQVANLFDSLDRHLDLCGSGQGWSDRQMVTS